MKAKFATSLEFTTFVEERFQCLICMVNSLSLQDSLFWELSFWTIPLAPAVFLPAQIKKSLKTVGFIVFAPAHLPDRKKIQRLHLFFLICLLLDISNSISKSTTKKDHCTDALVFSFSSRPEPKFQNDFGPKDPAPPVHFTGFNLYIWTSETTDMCSATLPRAELFVS